VSLRDHARRELELIGEEPGTIDWYLRVVDAFRSFGHSGGSAFATIPIINKLLSYEALSPLTEDPDEWIDRSVESGGEPMWQSRRDPRAFSGDGGTTYYYVNDSSHETHVSESPRHRGDSGAVPKASVRRTWIVGERSASESAGHRYVLANSD